MKTCCICEGDFDGYGANPEPFKGVIGTCCPTCDERFVIPVRILWGRRGLPDGVLETLKHVAELGAMIANTNKLAREAFEEKKTA